jgi:hypothetical protein
MFVVMFTRARNRSSKTEALYNIKLMHILGNFPSSINLKDLQNIKNSRRFGSWLCFRHQVKPRQLGPLKSANISIFPMDPTDLLVWFHLMTEAHSASGTKCVFKSFKLIYEGKCPRICISFMTHLHKKPLDKSCNMLFFHGEELLALDKTLSRRTIPCRLFTTACPILSASPHIWRSSFLEDSHAVWTRTHFTLDKYPFHLRLRTRHAVWTRTHLTRDKYPFQHSNQSRPGGQHSCLAFGRP